MRLLSVEDVMDVLDVSRNYVQWLREYKLLKMWKIGNKYRTTQDCIDEFIERTEGCDLSGKGDIITYAIRHRLM